MTNRWRWLAGAKFFFARFGLCLYALAVLGSGSAHAQGLFTLAVTPLRVDAALQAGQSTYDGILTVQNPSDERAVLTVTPIEFLIDPQGNRRFYDRAADVKDPDDQAYLKAHSLTPYLSLLADQLVVGPHATALVRYHINRPPTGGAYWGGIVLESRAAPTAINGLKNGDVVVRVRYVSVIQLNVLPAVSRGEVTALNGVVDGKTVTVSSAFANTGQSWLPLQLQIGVFDPATGEWIFKRQIDNRVVLPGRSYEAKASWTLKTPLPDGALAQVIYNDGAAQLLGARAGLHNASGP